MMIHDDQVRFLRALFHRRQEAALEFRALLSGAKVAARVNAVPQFRVIRQKSQLGAVTRLRQLFPVADLREPVHFVNALQQRLPFELVHFLPAQKIVAAFHQRGPQVRRKMLLQERHVLIKQLFLQGFRGGGNHDAPPAAYGRNQICESLARAGSRFDDRVLMLLKSLIHDFRHGQLRGTKFVPRVTALEQSASPKDPFDRHFLGFCSSSFFRHWVRWRDDSWHSHSWLCRLKGKIAHAHKPTPCRDRLFGNQRIYRISWDASHTTGSGGTKGRCSVSPDPAQRPSANSSPRRNISSSPTGTSGHHEPRPPVATPWTTIEFNWAKAASRLNEPGRRSSSGRCLR